MDAIQAGLAQRAQPEAIQPRTVRPVAESTTVENQVPVTAIWNSDEDSEEAVPESFSSDESEEEAK